MKFIKYFLVLFLAIGITSCSNDDSNATTQTSLTLAELPAPIKDYLNVHFASKSLVSAFKSNANNTITYDVKLSDAIDLKFNAAYNPTYVYSTNGVPNSVIPQAILDYVAANYPNNTIVDWDLEDDYQEVELDNGIELEFTLDGVFIRIDMDDDEDEEDDVILTGNAIPAGIITYVNAHFASNAILKVVKETDDNEVNYEVYLQGNIELEFNAAVQIISISSDTQLPNSVIPQNILAYVTSNYPGQFITEWELEDDNQQVELNNGIEITFSLNGAFISVDEEGSSSSDTPIAAADLPILIKTFITTHFPTNSIVKAVQKIKNNTVKYEVDLSNNVDLEFNSAYQITEMDSPTQLPSATLPASIVTYVTANYAADFIVKYELKTSTQKVELNNGVELKFDLNGVFISTENN